MRQCRPLLASLGLAAVLAPPALHAQTPSPEATAVAPPLTLASAVRSASARDPDIARLRAEAAAIRQRAPLERELMPPMVGGGAWQWPLDSGDPRDAQWMVTMSQEFPGRGKRAARSARVEADAAVTLNEIDAKGREVAVAVVRAYVDLRVAREELDILARQRALVRQGIEEAELRYAAGRASQQDALAGVVELSRLAQEAVMASERERMARSTLNVLLGVDVDAPIGDLDPSADDAPVPRLADLEARLAATHPEMTAVDRVRDVASADLVVAGQEGQPDYVVQAGYMSMPSMPNALQFSVGFTWPSAPWTKRRVEAATAAAEASIAAADARREGVTQRLRLMAQELIVRASAAMERAAVLRETIVPQTEHALEVARIGYLADRGDYMPLVDAQRVLLSAQLEIRRAHGDHDRALNELRALLGEFDTVSSTGVAR